MTQTAGLRAPAGGTRTRTAVAGRTRVTVRPGTVLLPCRHRGHARARSLQWQRAGALRLLAARAPRQQRRRQPDVGPPLVTRAVRQLRRPADCQVAASAPSRRPGVLRGCPATVVSTLGPGPVLGRSQPETRSRRAALLRLLGRGRRRARRAGTTSTCPPGQPPIPSLRRGKRRRRRVLSCAPRRHEMSQSASPHHVRRYDSNFSAVFYVQMSGSFVTPLFSHISQKSAPKYRTFRDYMKSTPC